VHAGSTLTRNDAPKSFSKHHLPSENRRRRDKHCHTGVTTRREFGDSTGDSLRRVSLVGLLRESLRNSRIQPMSDWGQVIKRGIAVWANCFWVSHFRFMASTDYIRLPLSRTMTVRRAGQAGLPPLAVGANWSDGRAEVIGGPGRIGQPVVKPRSPIPRREEACRGLPLEVGG
jgi:hypothetical protein